MEPTAEKKPLSLTLVVDTENNRVVFAEANEDVVDVLLSFLTLPVGTIVRLLCKEKSDQLPTGCMNNLYQSVKKLDPEYFQNYEIKTRLLLTRNSSADECRKLKVNIDDTEPIKKFYMCNSFGKIHSSKGLSTISNIQCICGQAIHREISYRATDFTKANNGGVFIIKVPSSFVITDDLCVMPASIDVSLTLTEHLQVESLETKTITFGHKEVLRLLENMLSNKKTLTNTFLRESQDDQLFHPQVRVKNEFCFTKESDMKNVKNISLKIALRKSTQIPIYAEAGDDFVNFLVSLLTFPLGAVVKLLKKVLSLGCINNLYESVETLDGSKYIRSEEHKNKLVSPGLALQYGCEDQFLEILEVCSPRYFLECDYRNEPSSISTDKPGHNWYTYIDLMEVKRFIKLRTKFMVTNDLIITPFSSISALKLLEQLKIPVDDVEKRELTIGQEEILLILESAMISSNVLGNVLSSATAKKPKQEIS